MRMVSPTNWVYILVNLVLVLLGALVVEAWKSNSYIFAIGTSLVATGGAGLVTFFYVKLNEDTQRRIEILRDFGLLDIFEKRGFAIASEYNNYLDRASSEVDIIGFGLSSFLADYRDSFDAWKQKVHVRILLIDPDYPSADNSFAAQREKEEDLTPATMKNDVQKFISETRGIVGKGTHGSFAIKLYRCLPAVNIFRIDSVLFWGPYLSKKLSRSSPTFLVGQGILFDVFVSHFEKIWSDPSLSREVDGDS